MAKITQMATTASTEVVSLQKDGRQRERGEEERKQEKNKVRLSEALTNAREPPPESPSPA